MSVQILVAVCRAVLLCKLTSSVCRVPWTKPYALMGPLDSRQSLGTLVQVDRTCMHDVGCEVVCTAVLPYCCSDDEDREEQEEEGAEAGGLAAKLRAAADKKSTSGKVKGVPTLDIGGLVMPGACCVHKICTAPVGHGLFPHMQFGPRRIHVGSIRDVRSYVATCAVAPSTWTYYSTCAGCCA